jgi:hypothetical protein
MSKNTLMVFTGRSPKQILDEKGTQAWALSARRARMCKYVVCVQNRNTLERFSPTEPHDMAFMIGKITEVSPSEERPEAEEDKPERYIIKFREYARIAVNAGPLRKGSRNPVSYIDIMALGIDPESLEYETISDSGVESDTATPIEDRPLTMAQAKKGLALTFRVPPDAVEITIHG